MKIKAIAPWFGSKRTLAPRIVEELGKHFAYWEANCSHADQSGCKAAPVLCPRQPFAPEFREAVPIASSGQQGPGGRLELEALRERARGLLWPESESGIQRLVARSSQRVDRLAAIGNSVIPVVAAVAFTVLYRRLKGDSPSWPDPR